MIKNVSNGPTDLFKTANKPDKMEISDKNTQKDNTEAQKKVGEQVTLGYEEKLEVTYKRLDASQSITIKFQMIQQIVTSLSLSQGAAGAIGNDNQNPSTNDLLTQIFKKLGLSTSIDIGDGKQSDLQTMTPEDAQKLIADDGYWGVDKTSSRIADFAIAQIGDDPSRVDKVKEAIMKGFNEAKEAFGGQLPEISQKTIDAVMEKIDKATKPETSE
jgi:hypothetical protein